MIRYWRWYGREVLVEMINYELAMSEALFKATYLEVELNSE